MSRALGRIQGIAPHVRIEISSIIDEPTSDYLERGYLDLIITPTEMASHLHPSELLFDDQLVAVAWSGNKHIQDGLTLDTYLSLGHIITRFGNVMGGSLDEIFIARSGYQRRIDVAVSSFSMLINQLVGTQLVGTIHERFARYYAQFLPIRFFPCPVSIPPFEVRLQWHRFHDSDLGIQWLRKALRESVADLEPLLGDVSTTKKDAKG